MSHPRDCRHDAAAFALGALEPAEADEFRRHVQSCAVCRDELAAFEQAVNALPMAAPQYEVPPGLKRRVMQAVRSEPKSPAVAPARRRPSAFRAWLPRPVLGAGVALAAAAAVVGGLELSSSGSPSHVIQAQVGQAQLRVAGGRADLIIRHLPQPSRGRIYELWLQRGTRSPAPSTLFSVTSGGTADVGVPAGLQGVRRVMVTSEPAGGSTAPTEQPVIVVNA
jgi:anti-sigma-K factor RskA